MIHCFWGEILLHCVHISTHKDRGIGGGNKYFHYLSSSEMILQTYNGLAYILYEKRKKKKNLKDFWKTSEAAGWCFPIFASNAGFCRRCKTRSANAECQKSSSECETLQMEPINKEVTLLVVCDAEKDTPVLLYLYACFRICRMKANMHKEVRLSSKPTRPQSQRNSKRTIHTSVRVTTAAEDGFSLFNQVSHLYQNKHFSD